MGGTTLELNRGLASDYYFNYFNLFLAMMHKDDTIYIFMIAKGDKRSYNRIRSYNDNRSKP